MPTQLRKRSTPGSSNKTAITIEIDSSDSNDIAHARLHAAGRGKQAAASGKMKASSSRATSSKAAPQDFSSDSDSSDAIFVATSRRVDKGKQPETKASGGTSARREEPIASKAAKLPTSSPTNSAEENKTRTRQLPTPESLPSEDSESVVEAEPKRLLKADRTPVKDGSRDDLAGRSTGPRTGPSFVERLQANSTPQFSKTFKGKVRSSASTSIPLNDARFESDEDDDEYESDDRPSARKRRIVGKKSTPASARKRSTKAFKTMVASDSDDSDVLPSSKLPSHHDVTADSDGEELPDVLSTLQSQYTARNSSPKKSSQFKENLEQLNKRRRLSDRKAKSREKRAKRVVVSPSPEPVQVVASHPSIPSSSMTASGKIRKRINVRETSSKGKHPPRRILFRAPSDDSDTNQASEATEATEDDEQDSGNRSKRRRDEGKRLQAREPAPTSSSSSSSSSGSDSSLVSDDDEELEPEVENIKLDFDPVLKDKLRPKDDSKARRLDKLREARAAKEMRERNRRKGIIDIDSDDGEPGKQIPTDEEEEDSEGDSTSSADVENFIVEDDGLVDEEEMDRIHRMMPTQFSKHAALPLKDHFHIFITGVVFRYFLPKSKQYRDKEEFNYSQLQLQNAINGLINGSIASSIWKEDFRAALDARPEMVMYEIPYLPGCEGCNKHDRTASKEAHLSGKPYDRDTLVEDSDDEEEEQIFHLGRFCAEKADFHHNLRHFLKKTADTIRDQCRRRSTLGDKLIGDKYDRKERREKEAERIVGLLAKGSFPLQAQLWGELDQLMEKAKHKYLK